MKVRFLKEVADKYTGKIYSKGDVAEFGDLRAETAIANGFCEVFAETTKSKKKVSTESDQ